MNREAIEIDLRKIKTDAASISTYIDKTEWNSLETIGVAATIASIYSGYESIFRNLCENKIIKSEHWHKELLNDAAIKGFIPSKLKNALEEMLGFRHIQRNYYSHELKEQRVRKMAIDVINTVVPALSEHLQKFI